MINLQIILNSDEEIYGGQGLIDRDQYAQRTISRKWVLVLGVLWLSSLYWCMQAIDCDKPVVCSTSVLLKSSTVL